MASGTGQHIHLITGGTQSGKTTLVARLVKQLKSEQLVVRGFICHGTMVKGTRTDYQLTDLDGTANIPLASIEPKQGWERIGRFSFNPEAWIQGEAMIRSGLSGNPDLVVVDEVGPLELQGGGWTRVLELLSNAPHVEQLWVVREQILTDVIRQWDVPEANVYRLLPGKEEELISSFTNNLVKKIGL